MAPTIILKSYQTNDGTKTALVKLSGPKWIHVMVLDGPLTVRKVPADEMKYMSDMTIKNGKAYPMKRALRHFRHFAKTSGVTKNAKRFLAEANRRTTCHE